MLTREEYEQEMRDTYCIHAITKGQVLQITSKLFEIVNILSATKPTPRLKLLRLLASKMLFITPEVYFYECE